MTNDPFCTLVFEKLLRRRQLLFAFFCNCRVMSLIKYPCVSFDFFFFFTLLDCIGVYMLLFRLLRHNSTTVRDSRYWNEYIHGPVLTCFHLVWLRCYLVSRMNLFRWVHLPRNYCNCVMIAHFFTLNSVKEISGITSAESWTKKTSLWSQQMV